ncbi:response regulator [Limnoglobus roseus]|uniref:response regulator n=1 Tax=Limnoglobus roseus TaxID=2598579 RepID=UPI001FEAEDD1|nr:response regulator [Limnoglobus roseus]
MVDDNRDAADSLSWLLRLLGFETSVCYDGMTALQSAMDFLPHVGLIDLHMPGMDGDELALKLRAQAAGRPLFLVAITAMSNADAYRRTTSGGFDLHLVKPVDPASLVTLIINRCKDFFGL